jgi:DNA invertase Pin-like site-specific DNA recombinase
MNFNDYSKPKFGGIFHVIGVGRISKKSQDELSLGDQKAYYSKWLDREYGAGNYRLTVIATQGSGQILDRDEFIELCDMVASGKYDLVIAEDIGRIVRRIHAVIFCEEAEDTATRVVGINDPVDTAVAGWEQNAIFASFKHSAFCKDTSERIKRTLRNRFLQGQIFQCEIYGYIKPKAKATDMEVRKDPAAEEIYDEWFTRLEEGRTYAMVSDWLNDNNVPTGPHCRSDKWTGRMVQRVTFSEILKGERIRNKRYAERVNKTGRSKTKKSPPGHQLSRMVPHLAFIEPERYDRVIRLLKKRNAKYKRSESERNDPRAGISKRSTRFPGQLCRCGVCGRLFVFGGHGKKERLMCNGARDHTCWNAMTISGPDVARAVSTQVRQFIENMEGFDAEWVAEYQQQRESFASDKNGELESLQKELVATQRKLANQSDALEKIGASDSIVARIKELDNLVLELNDKISLAKKIMGSRPELPSLEKIKSVCNEVFNELSIESVEFANLMRNAITDFYVLPYRLVDGGHVQPRVRYRVSLASFLPHLEVDLPILQFEGEVDLAKQPVRVVIREDVVAMVEQEMKHAVIAEQLGVTKTEVGNAMALHRCMLANGLSDPWVPMASEEQVRDYFKRVRNPRFKFQPLEGFEETKHPRN